MFGTILKKGSEVITRGWLAARCLLWSETRPAKQKTKNERNRQSLSIYHIRYHIRYLTCYVRQTAPGSVLASSLIRARNRAPFDGVAYHGYRSVKVLSARALCTLR